MPTITIRQSSSPTNATLSIDHGEEWPITVTDPFTPAEEARLGWYFEEHLQFPFTDKVKAEDAARSVTEYGEKLFRQVFADPDAYARYAEARKAGLESLVIEIAGEPEFHALHWEALKDPKLPRALSLDAVFARRNLKPQTVGATTAESPTINVLVVTARPGGAEDVAYRTISRPLVEALGQANLRVRVDLLRPGTYRALTEHLERTRDAHGAGYYHVVHFDCHGALLEYREFDAFERALVDSYSYQPAAFQSKRYGRPHLAPYEGMKGFIFLEAEGRDGQGNADPVEAGELANLLQVHKVPVVILNACQSAKQARADSQARAAEKADGQAAQGDGAAFATRETSVGAALMAAGAQLVVAMGYSVTVSAARLFMETFYGALFEHGEPAKAIRRARQALLNDKARRAYFYQKIELEDWLLPVAYQNREARLATREFTGPEATAYYAKRAGRYQAPKPTYGFFGRDLDVLAAERLVLDRNLLLIRGMGGAGKSALLRHLGEWWQTTGFVDEVFYFGWDERAWNRQQILRGVAEKLLPPGEFHGAFEPMSEAAQQAYLAEKLRGTRHLLILDNLESITGTHLAIKNTLSEEERAKLRDFLHAIEGGKTVVLMGSRAGEEWLLGKLKANTYALPGLDQEAATGLANEVLRRQGATKCWEDPALIRLMKLCAGYPQFIELVLSNMPKKSPTEVLEALKDGLPGIDSGSAEKTESLIACIDYSFGNLEKEEQELLLALAPFTNIVYVPLLGLYIEILDHQKGSQNSDETQLSCAVDAATRWGLLNQHAIDGFRTIHPILPYFLRQCLGRQKNTQRSEEIKLAFLEFYRVLASSIVELFRTRLPEDRANSLKLVELEFENWVSAITAALELKRPFIEPYLIVSEFLKARQDHHALLDLSGTVWGSLIDYRVSETLGKMGVDFACVLDDSAHCLFELRQLEQARINYEAELAWLAAIEKESGYSTKSHRGRVNHELGLIAEEQYHWARARLRYRKALRIALAQEERGDQANTYHQLGVLSSKRGKWKSAKTYLTRALELSQEVGDLQGSATTYHELGLVAQEQGKWREAQDYYSRSLEIAHDYNDGPAQAKTYHALGIMATERGLWNEAEVHLRTALELWITYPNRYQQGTVYLAFARLAVSKQEREQATAYFGQALEIFAKHGDDILQVVVLRMLAILWDGYSSPEIPVVVSTALGVSIADAEDLLRAAWPPVE